MSGFAVKLDENLGRSHVQLLRDLGYEADRLVDQGLGGAADPLVWQHVTECDRFFITLDLDFSDIRRYPPGTHPGILLVRARSNSQAAVTEILQRVVREVPLSWLAGCLTVADSQQTRTRRPQS